MFINRRKFRKIIAALTSGVKITSKEGFDALIAEFNELKRSEGNLRKEVLEAERRTLRTKDQHLHAMLTHHLRSFSGQSNIRRQTAPAQERGNALIVTTTPSQFPHIAALCGHSAFRRRYQPIIFAHLDVAATGLKEFCEEQSLPLVDFTFRLVNSGSLSDLEGLFSYLSLLFAHREGPSAHLPQPLAGDVAIKFAELAAEVTRQITLARMISITMTHCAASIIILFEDNAEHDTGIWISCAKEQGIPSLIIPFTIADQIEPAEAHYHDPLFWADADVLNGFAARIYPKWTFKYRDRLLIRRFASRVIAAESLGFAQPDPWVLNSSYATCMAVESHATFNFYEQLGVANSQMRLTGSFVDDVVFEANHRRAQLQQELGLDAERPMLLCGFPPNQLTDGRGKSEFKTFDELIVYWMEQLRKLDGWQVVIRPHPAMARTDIDTLLTFPFVVSEMDTAKLIPLCNIYNTSVSSTIRWALACGKPVLNFDVFQYHYREYADETAVWTTHSGTEFSDCIERIVKNRSLLDQLSILALACANKWGTIDGRSGDRIVQLMDSIILGAAEGPPVWVQTP